MSATVRKKPSRLLDSFKRMKPGAALDEQKSPKAIKKRRVSVEEVEDEIVDDDDKGKE